MATKVWMAHLPPPRFTRPSASRLPATFSALSTAGGLSAASAGAASARHASKSRSADVVARRTERNEHGPVMAIPPSGPPPQGTAHVFRAPRVLLL